MKKASACLIFVITFLAACRVFPIQPAEPGLEHNPSAEPAAPQPIDWDDRSLYKSGLAPSQQAALNTLKNASVYHLYWNIAEDFTFLTGIEEVRYINCEQVPLEEIHLRLFPNLLGGEMEINTILANGMETEGILELSNSLLRVPLAQDLHPGDGVVLHLEYSLSVPAELDSNYGVLAFYDNVLTLAHAYPMVAVYDDEGWNVEIPPEYGDLTYADASFFQVQVNAPAQLVLAASGQEINRQGGGSRQIVTITAGPARDFFLAASPDYQVITRTVDNVTFNSYAPQSLASASRSALDTAIESFRIFSERYALYPYTEFDMVATPTYALGIEYPGIIALNANLYKRNGEVYGTPTTVMMESVIAHEAGHQWFYNLVGNDQLGEPWLDESLAQFVTWQYFTDRYGTDGGDDFEQSLHERWARVGNAPIPVGMPVAGYDSAAYSAIVYGRGAFFFMALREKIGAQAFDAFLQDYTESYGWGISSGSGLKTLAEDHCRCDLTGLFSEWITP